MWVAFTLTHSSSGIETSLFKFDQHDTPKGVISDFETPAGFRTRAQIWEDADQDEAKAAAIWVDDAVGSMISFLKTKGIYDETMVILVNDHGQTAKGSLEEAGIRQMMSIRYLPLWKEHHVVSDDIVVSSVDLAPLIFSVSGVNPSGDYVLDGQSWLDAVAADISGIHTTSHCCSFRMADNDNQHVAIGPTMKYTFDACTGEEKLMNLEDGTTGSRRLLAKPWRKRTKSPEPTPNPTQEPEPTPKPTEPTQKPTLDPTPKPTLEPTTEAPEPTMDEAQILKELMVHHITIRACSPGEDCYTPFSVGVDYSSACAASETTPPPSTPPPSTPPPLTPPTSAPPSTTPPPTTPPPTRRFQGNGSRRKGRRRAARRLV